MIGALLVALTPTALLIGLGHVLRWRTTLLPEGFWTPAERLAYFVLLPALIVHSLAMADFSGVPVGAMVVALAVPLLVVGAGLVVSRRAVELPGPAFTSVFQGAIRFNTYVGVTAAIALYGSEGAALAAIAIATIVPTVNVLCVLVFAHYASTGAGLRTAMRSIVTNPLIIACAVGIALHVAGLPLPPGIEGFVKSLGQSALPLGLLCVGAALDRRTLGASPRAALIASGAKFAAMPTLTAMACLALGLTGVPALIAVLFNALPTASSSYVMARQLGGDAPLMASLVATQTVAAAVTLPVAMILAEAIFT
ncbi:AEC family transporter [Acuticoccus sp. I52.16.1]|uniref:AEC family transporter n=1 Tax=Acuticoccus sp. I52.16.1 TaxID=2928472 RepID=UPI001FD0317A|nr:AEC family transporter [Acuticoccus sp. I52.16.1]UOM35031.1 AEC family transporter [Acuticoccus sp. I52.16.1]